ncbi:MULTISPECIES: Eco57I restriction-modification methylase domain-containing protein [unclassified Tolypothrix]|uniref:Eco57I restriction-modification methylase domain-containing protein n=1 Tax=unclassified Tolypothrix TaxID=2649714 RepID=UPI0005EAA926|nr:MULTISPECIES: N-6 DNA methylase [unclassified Tolypothrix]BAY93786.1 N-6 DNA methylase [Microchaete diplosiphon NIES-3275]EKF03379.1 putative DNA methyltransferase [Tolypothrix sp. PCC 7601]MBE9081910.1 N-6 DNA methylase [Tolypothrix sp. LEGE 11397]UYD27581.1 N-6 DNA methylase [Tolypothrix sp. PCC 7712]UYD36559.1 N-6 DNA methylase [Tolypothrix sp. PCC 7601]
MNITQLTEETRVKRQTQLDAAKTQIERNKLGQFATPIELASAIVEYAKSLLPQNQNIRFLDPAFGTGSFYSALLQLFPQSQIGTAVGYEIDSHYGNEAISLWKNTPLQLNINDFTKAIPPENQDKKANLIICNPPYVRHHHLTRSDKLRLQNQSQNIAGVKLSQLASLYCHFLCIADAWMAKDGIAGWLIPSGFMDVNYGQQIKDYLLNKVTLLRVHRFCANDVQFDDALVSSAIVWFQKTLPSKNHTVEFSYGGSLTTPNERKYISSEILHNTVKWTTIGSTIEAINFNLQRYQLKDLFTIKRGLATGANNFFILTKEQAIAHQIPAYFLKPILPSPRYLLLDEISADALGNPILEQQLFLLDCNLPVSEIENSYPTLWKYLQMGIETGMSSHYLCKHRNPWYSQENRSPAPYLCTYMGRTNSSRGKAFRFILNNSNAIAANVYLMLYPKTILADALTSQPSLKQDLWLSLNDISQEALISGGRVYGGGLHKLEPKELGNLFIGIALNIPV